MGSMEMILEIVRAKCRWINKMKEGSVVQKLSKMLSKMLTDKFTLPFWTAKFVGFLRWEAVSRWISP